MTHRSQRSPRIGIGLPVYNAQRYLEPALDSLLGQTFTDFELVISDNASDDATPEICSRYAAADARVRYHRNESNIGAAANFDRAFELTSDCEYFKWAAGDDLCEPTFLARCIEVLDNDATAVLAYARTRMIDADGRSLGDYDVKLDTDVLDPVRRFNVLTRGHKCFEIFGLIRRDALAGTPLMGPYSHGDGVLLARLALLGRFVEIPEPLFLSRRHDEQSGTMEDDRQSYAVWFAPQLASRTLFPHWRTYFEFFRSIHRAPTLTAGQRLRCYRRLFFRVLAARRHLQEDVHYNLRRLKARLFSRQGGALGRPGA